MESETAQMPNGDRGSLFVDLVDLTWWRQMFDRLVVFAAQNPGTFLSYVLLGLTPLFLASAVLSWKLAKHLEKDEKEKKRKAKREAGIAKARSNAAEKDKSSSSSASAASSSSSPSTKQSPNRNKGRQKGHNKRD